MGIDVTKFHFIRSGGIATLLTSSRKIIMKNRTAALALASLAALSLSGCMASMARSDPSMSDRFQPLIGTRGSLYMIGQTAQMGILRMDEDGECVSRSAGDMSLVMLPMFAADLPATAACDLIHLPMDVATEVRKSTESDGDDEPR